MEAAWERPAGALDWWRGPAHAPRSGAMDGAVSRPDDDDFLGRWSARKVKARAAPSPGPAPAPAAAPPIAAPPAEAVQEKSDAEILHDLGLPDPDSLAKGDDFKAFLRAGVPARLRARALRRLWLSDPVLANLDGLNDYEQDFTDRATVLPDLETAYRVGQGFLREPPAPVAAGGARLPPPEKADMTTERDSGAGAGNASPGSRPGGPAAAAAAAGGVPERDGPAPDGEARPATSQGAAARPPRTRFRFEAG